MTDEYHADSALKAEALLALAKELDRTRDGGEPARGLDETLTVLRLGGPTLARTQRSTNAIKSMMISICREHADNINRWRDGQRRCAGDRQG